MHITRIKLNFVVILLTVLSKEAYTHVINSHMSFHVFNMDDNIDLQVTSQCDTAELQGNADTFLTLVNTRNRFDSLSENDNTDFQATSQSDTAEQDNADSDTDNDNSENPHVKRKCSRKLHGSAVYSTTYQASWEKSMILLKDLVYFQEAIFTVKFVIRTCPLLIRVQVILKGMQNVKATSKESNLLQINPDYPLLVVLTPVAVAMR